MAKGGRKTVIGVGVSEGTACAPALRYDPGALQVPQGPAGDREREAAAFLAACEQVGRELADGAARARARAGETEAEIFDVHRELLEDEISLQGPVLALIREEGRNAADAAQRQFDLLARRMRGLPDPYLRQRADDFLDLKEQVLRALLRRPKADLGGLPGPVILAARSLTPSDTLRLDPKRIAGVLCAEGGGTSHAAILARALGIPAVVGCPEAVDGLRDGERVLLDGGSGEVVLGPTPEEEAAFRLRQRRLEERREELVRFRDRPARTRDGALIRVLANAAAPEEVEAAVAAGADGVGLLRSEFLYLGREDLPGEEEQFQAYRRAVSLAGGRPVTIRTLDVGGDKALPALGLESEENPALGCRGIRVCLDRPGVLRTQLRALYRASAYGRLQIMFPMVSSLEELRRARDAARQARLELEGEGVPFDPRVPLGMMVEVPAAAVLAERFAREADFFSIGTNDLIQYTVAADRSNRKVEGLYSACHPAVVELTARTVRAAREAGIGCCLCGEAAGDLTLLPLLVGLGLDSLSVSVPGVPGVKRAVCGLSRARAEDLYRRVSALGTADEVRSALE